VRIPQPSTFNNWFSFSPSPFILFSLSIPSPLSILSLPSPHTLLFYHSFSYQPSNCQPYESLPSFLTLSPFPFLLQSPPFKSHPFPFPVPARGSEERCKLPSKQAWAEPGHKIVSRPLWVKDHILVTVCHLTLVRLPNAIVLCGRRLMRGGGAPPTRIFDSEGNYLILSASMCNQRRKQCRQLTRPPNFLIVAYQHFFLSTSPVISGRRNHNSSQGMTTEKTTSSCQSRPTTRN